MSEIKFKIGDVVNHKSNTGLKMVIINNGRFDSGANVGNKNPDSFVCRYYSPDIHEWKTYTFEGFELSKSL